MIWVALYLLLERFLFLLQVDPLPGLNRRDHCESGSRNLKYFVKRNRALRALPHGPHRDFNFALVPPVGGGLDSLGFSFVRQVSGTGVIYEGNTPLGEN